MDKKSWFSEFVGGFDTVNSGGGTPEAKEARSLPFAV